MYRSTRFLFGALTIYIIFVATLVYGDRVNSPEDDLYLLGLNQNQRVQDALQRYNYDSGHDQNPLVLSRDLLERLSKTPDPRYAADYRSDRPPYNTGPGGDQYRSPYNSNNDRNRDGNPYDIYPGTNRVNNPRQYFNNDPQYSLREDEILKIFSQIDVSASQQCNINVRAQWDFETNVNDVNQIRAVGP